MATFFSDLTDQTNDALRQGAAYVDDLTTPSLRLGVTGLARAGKTVFITALVRTLTTGGAEPALAERTQPGFRAFLEPQPDDDVPRFAYENHLDDLTGAPAQWPESTRHISELRVTLEWDASDWMRQIAGIKRRLHIDIIDYPGEWLADIGMLGQDYATWSANVSSSARAAPESPDRSAWLAFEAALADDRRDAEQIALEGARLFTAHLAAAKRAGRLAPSAGPGRFLMPGDYEGSPLLTFFPLVHGRDPVRAVLARRFEAYKTSIVKPFFEKHFSRLDRQIVLVDVLGALNLGPAAMLEMENALERALEVFRPGRESWLGRLLGARTSTILFAATKADHLHRNNHPRLRAILNQLVDRASKRSAAAGARIAFAAIAALRTTEDVERIAANGSPPLECVRGLPVDGEMLNGRPLDCTKALTIFPGDLPADPIDAFDPDIMVPGTLNFIRFCPRLTPNSDTGVNGAPAAWPHVGLDRVVAFLIGDRLT